MKRRVLYLATGSIVNGALLSLQSLAGALPKDQYQVCLAATSSAPFAKLAGDPAFDLRIVPWQTFRPVREGFDLEMARLPVWRRAIAVSAAIARLIYYFPQQWRLIRRLCADFQPDVLHFNGFSLLPVGIAAKPLGIPQVWHVRAEPSQGAWGRLVSRMIPQLASAVVAVSDGTAERMDRSLGNVLVANDGADFEIFQPGVSGGPVRAELGIPAGAPCVGYVGRVLPGKGIFDWTDAAGKIAAAEADTHFIMVGGASEQVQAELHARMGSLGLEAKFHLTGPRNDVPALLAAMNVFVQPSYSEGLGRAVVEAMLMEKAIVTTPLPGLQDLIVPGKNGAFVDFHQPEQIAAQALRFLRDPALAAACGRQARQDALQRFNLEAFLERMTRMYDEVCSGKDRGKRKELKRT